MIKLRVKEVAEAQGVPDPTKLARRADIAYATAHRLWNDTFGENSEKGPGLYMLHRVAKSIGVRVADLYIES